VNKFDQKYYDFIFKKNVNITKEEKIIFDIVYDLSDRRGLKQEWDNIDDDVKEEIIQKWINIVKKYLGRDK